MLLYITAVSPFVPVTGNTHKDNATSSDNAGPRFSLKIHGKLLRLHLQKCEILACLECGG